MSGALHLIWLIRASISETLLVLLARAAVSLIDETFIRARNAALRATLS